MMDCIAEIKENSNNQRTKNLDMRCGIHTGKIVAGIIGTKLVRYDIFGEGVQIAQGLEQEGVIGKVCISEDTRNYLLT